MNELGPSLSLLGDHPEPEFAEEADLLSAFLRGIHDWSDIWDEIGPGEQVRVAFDLGLEIQELTGAGFSLYVGCRNKILEGGEGPRFRGVRPSCSSVAPRR